MRKKHQGTKEGPAHKGKPFLDENREEFLWCLLGWLDLGVFQRKSLDEFACPNIASKVIKMPKTGFRNVISGKTRWQDHFKVFEIY